MIRFNYQDNLQKHNLFQNKDFLSGSFIALIALTFFLMIHFLALPLFHPLQLSRATIKENQTLLKSLEKKQQTLNQVEKIYKQVSSSSSASINEAIPNYSDTPLIMSLIEKIGSEIIEAQGPLLIESISVAELPNDQPTNSFSLTPQENEVQVSFIGDYQAIKDFITQLKSLKHNFSVEQISFSAPKNTSLNQLLTVSVKLRYYYFNES